MRSEGGLACFAYARCIAPMLWALVALSIGELCLVHLLVAVLWSGWVAAGLSLLTLCGLAWLVAALRSFGRTPVVVGPRRVLLRVGWIKGVTVPRSVILSVEGELAAAPLRARDVLKLSLLAHPNVVVRLREPVTLGRRSIRTIAHRLDDPARFRAALA